MTASRLLPVLPAAVAALALAAPAHAYIGPGVGLGVIGTVFGIVATLALAVFGFLWYPAKRLIAKRRGAGRADGQAAVADANRAASAPVDTAVAAVPDAHRAAPAGTDPAPAPGTPARPSVAGADVRTPERDGA